MDAQELKSRLKEARDAIKAQQYEKAIQICENILSIEKGNYNALVFTALAYNKMENYKNCFAYYRKALERDSKQLLAWQGLTQIVDKNEMMIQYLMPDDLRLIILAYETLITQEKDLDQTLNCIAKVAKIHLHVKDQELFISKCSEVIGFIDQNAESITAEKMLPILRTLITAFHSQKSLWQKNADSLLRLYDHYLKNLSKVFDSTSCENNNELIEIKNKEVEELPKLLKQYSKVIQTLDEQDLNARLDQCLALMSKYAEQNPSIAPLACGILIQSYAVEEYLKQDELSMLDKFKIYIENEAIVKLMDGIIFETRDNDKLKAIAAFKECLKLSLESSSINDDLEDNLHPSLPWLLLCNSSVRCHRYEDANYCLDHAKDVLKNYPCALLKQQVAFIHLRIILNDLNASQEDIRTFIDAHMELIQSKQSKLKWSLILFNIHMKFNEYDRAKTILDKILSDPSLEQHTYLQLKARLLLATNNIDEALSSLKEAELLKPEDSVTSKILGQAHLFKRDIMQAQTYFIKALQSDPLDPENYKQLGIIFIEFHKSLIYGQKFLEKCWQLRPNDREVGIALYNIYTDLNLHELREKFLRDIINKKPFATEITWAYFRLVLHLLDKIRRTPDTIDDDYSLEQMRDEVSGILRHLNRIKDANENYGLILEILGESYLERNCGASALECMQMRLEQEESQSNVEIEQPIYRKLLLRKAHSHMIRTEYHEAKECFQKVLDDEADEFWALLGLAEMHYRISAECFKKGVYIRGHEEIQNAFDHALNATKLRPKAISSWKLLAEICLLQCHIGKKDFSLSIKSFTDLPGSSMVKKLLNFEKSSPRSSIDRRGTLKLAIRVLNICISLLRAPKAASQGRFDTLIGYIWYKLAIAYLLLHRSDQNDPHKDSSLHNSLSAALMSLIHPWNISKCLNLIGIISLQIKPDDRLALTHRLISLSKYAADESNHPLKRDIKGTTELMDCNLGYLYLMQMESKKAFHSFCRSLFKDQRYTRAEIGSALSIENEKSVSEGNLLSPITLDLGQNEGVLLFQNCSSNQSQSIPLAHLIFVDRYLQSWLTCIKSKSPICIQLIDAWTSAFDAMTRYKQYQGDNSLACYYQGALCELRRDYKNSLASYAKGYRSLTSSPDDCSPQLSQLLALNYARLSVILALCDNDGSTSPAQELAENAVKELKNWISEEDPGTELKLKLFQALLAIKQTNRFEETHGQIIRSLLESECFKKLDLYSLLGALSFKHRQLAVAKNWFFKAVRLPETLNTIDTVLSLVVVSLRDGDVNIAETSLQQLIEASHVQNRHQWHVHAVLGLLSSSSDVHPFLSSLNRLGIRLLHQKPHELEYWLTGVMFLLLLMSNSNSSKANKKKKTIGTILITVKSLLLTVTERLHPRQGTKFYMRRSYEAHIGFITQILWALYNLKMDLMKCAFNNLSKAFRVEPHHPALWDIYRSLNVIIQRRHTRLKESPLAPNLMNNLTKFALHNILDMNCDLFVINSRDKFYAKAL